MRTPWREDPRWWVDEPDAASPPEAMEVYVTDNPVVAVLLGPDGATLLEVREREPIGFRLR